MAKVTPINVCKDLSPDERMKLFNSADAKVCSRKLAAKKETARAPGALNNAQYFQQLKAQPGMDAHKAADSYRHQIPAPSHFLDLPPVQRDMTGLKLPPSDAPIISGNGIGKEPKVKNADLDSMTQVQMNQYVSDRANKDCKIDGSECSKAQVRAGLIRGINSGVTGDPKKNDTIDFLSAQISKIDEQLKSATGTAKTKLEADRKKAQDRLDLLDATRSKVVQSVAPYGVTLKFGVGMNFTNESASAPNIVNQIDPSWKPTPRGATLRDMFPGGFKLHLAVEKDIVATSTNSKFSLGIDYDFAQMKALQNLYGITGEHTEHSLLLMGAWAYNLVNSDAGVVSVRTSLGAGVKLRKGTLDNAEVGPGGTANGFLLVPNTPEDPTSNPYSGNFGMARATLGFSYMYLNGLGVEVNGGFDYVVQKENPIVTVGDQSNNKSEPLTSEGTGLTPYVDVSLKYKF